MEGQYFRIHKPYGMKRNAKGYWEFFNREYQCLGYNNGEECPAESRIYYREKGLTEQFLLTIVDDDDSIRKDKSGVIHTVYFYNDNTSPEGQPDLEDAYFRLSLIRLNQLRDKQFAEL